MKIKFLIFVLIGLFGIVITGYAKAPTSTEIKPFVTVPNDSDKDGYSDLCEQLHKSDPQDKESIPRENISINVPSDVKTIQEAIDVAIDGDTILVAPGKYQGNINFNGRILTLTSTDSLNPDVVARTIIEGAHPGSVIIIDSPSTLRGFTITSTSSNCRGIYIKNASPTIENCIIIGNKTNNYGGGIYNDNSSPQIIACVIIKNSSKKKGGGIYNTFDSSPQIINSTISENTDNGHHKSAQTLNQNKFGSGQVYGGTPQITQSWINGQGLVTNTIETMTSSPEPRPETIEPPTIETEDSADTSIDPIENTDEVSPIIPLSGSPVWYVDDDAPDTGTGTSWVTAFKYLEDALNDTGILPGEEIWVAQGTYKPDQGSDTDIVIPGDRTATFQLMNGVTINGGYAGIGAPDPDERNIAIYETILSGDLIGDDAPNFANYADNSYHVVTGADNAVLDGFTIESGNANAIPQSGTNNGLNASGGGIFCWGTGPTINNCIIKNNQARSSGGGMRIMNTTNPSTATVTNCVFEGNSAGYGGGISILDSYYSHPPFNSVTVTNCIFIENTAFFFGGGVYVFNGQAEALTFTNCIFTGNIAQRRGGGIYIYGFQSSPTITNCTFSANLSTLEGGGMYNNMSNPTVTNCIFWGNGNEIKNFNSSNPTVTYSGIQGGYAGEGNIDSDPLFVDAGNPVGADGIFLTADDGLRIFINSPCIDSANDSEAPATDITEQGRIDIPDIGFAIADIGACESGHDFDSDGMPDEWESFYGLNPYNPDANDDPDSDVLVNLQEYLNGTDPTDPDTDDDLMPDGWEVQYNLDPLDPADANQDPDEDEVTNLWEYTYNTNPNNPDTDDDGLSDGYEIYAYSTDPNNPDSDGDGVSDGDEVNQGSDPTDPLDEGQPPTPEELLTLLETAYYAGDLEGIAINADKLMKQGSAATLQLLAVLQDEEKDLDFRGIIAEIIEEIKDPNSADALIAILEDVTQDTYIRTEAAYVLGTTESDTALAPLLDALNNPDIDIKSSAALGLGLLGREEAITPLIILLENTEEEVIVRVRCGEALSNLNTLLALDTFVDILQNDEDETMRGRSALWLGSLEHSDAVPSLIEAVNEDTSLYVADNAAIALGVIGDISAVDTLISALDRGGLLRINSAEALAQIGDLSAAQPIADAIGNEQDVWGKQKLIEAYEQLTGVEYQP